MNDFKDCVYTPVMQSIRKYDLWHEYNLELEYDRKKCWEVWCCKGSK